MVSSVRAGAKVPMRNGRHHAGRENRLSPEMSNRYLIPGETRPMKRIAA
jgi:hypothetical protein